jgi:predicted nuclease of predicted toxin-antitoxin system
LRFLVDRCAGRRLAEWLRSLGHDVAEGRERGPDPGDRVVLEWAAHEHRVLITMDKDFGELLFLQGASHAGLIRLPDMPVSARIAVLERLLQDHASDIEGGAVITIRGERIRISRTTS